MEPRTTQAPHTHPPKPARRKIKTTHISTQDLSAADLSGGSILNVSIMVGEQQPGGRSPVFINHWRQLPRCRAPTKNHHWQKELQFLGVRVKSAASTFLINYLAITVVISLDCKIIGTEGLMTEIILLVGKLMSIALTL